MDQKVLLKVEGMDCANCALTITRTLSKEGLKEVSVNFMTGEVSFNKPGTEVISGAVRSIHRLGYRVKSRSDEIGNPSVEDHLTHSNEKPEWKFYVSLIFTVPLVLHMFLHYSFLHEPLFQLVLCLPVMIIGTMHFGKSAFYSLRAGIPNMDVLIFTGSTAAFVYSLSGMIKYYGTPEVHQYMFFETGATIITLVLLGNLIEQRSVKQTTSALSHLHSLQPRTAKKVEVNNGIEIIVECNVEDLKIGETVIINTGDRIPMDGRIIFGQASVNESMLTGESQPVFKTIDDEVTGGTIIEDGNVRFIIEHVGQDTVLSRIIELVKAAQHSKPKIQKLGDRISAVFVPVVMGISILTFIISVTFLNITVSKALMSSIAVLVISCPCAMGLATPTAVMVGLGRAASNGILIKGGATIELLAGVKTLVFDKTGTLTTGNFRIKNITCITGDESMIRPLLYSLEKHSSHPIAKALQKELLPYSSSRFKWKQITEDKGIGINATDADGNLYSAGSMQMVKHFYKDLAHDIYVLKNNELLATVDLEDEVKPHVSDIISDLKKKGMRVIMLSGDRQKKCEFVAAQTGITEVYFEKLPKEKLEILDKLVKENPTAMIGDGVNDAPALAQASVGISISNASETAIQSAQIILLDRLDLHILLKAFRISEMTYSTIKQNLFWAFFYNVIAIPIAAAGMLNPMVGALSMAFSDVIVIGNSLRLRIRRIR